MSATEAAVAPETPATEPAAKAVEAVVVDTDPVASPAATPAASPNAAGAINHNTTAGVSETVQAQMDAGVSAAEAAAMEYANYVTSQRTEG